MTDKKAAPKKVAEHPTYAAMVAAALVALKDRKGSSKQAIEKFICANYKVGPKYNGPLKMALKKGVETGTLVQTKGKGASGSFKIAKVEKEPVAKKAPVKKPAAKKVTEKKAAKSPKKPVAKKAPAKAKLPVPKSPAKKAKAPAKSPKKKATPKKTAAKPAPSKKPASKATSKAKASPVKKVAKKPAAKKPAAKKTKAKK